MILHKYKAILVPDPQDYFEGREPKELTETIEFFNLFNYSKIQEILQMVDNGYKAIIMPIEGDNSG